LVALPVGQPLTPLRRHCQLALGHLRMAAHQGVLSKI
jgi:hypothetical protein